MNGNRKGPENKGPKTGRVLGFCVGLNNPGCLNKKDESGNVITYEHGRGRGYRNGLGLGQGRGFGNGRGAGNGRGMGLGFRNRMKNEGEK